MVKSESMVTGCPDRPEHRMQICHRDATLRPNLSSKLHARQLKLVYSELFRGSLGCALVDRKRLLPIRIQPGGRYGTPHPYPITVTFLSSPESTSRPLSVIRIVSMKPPPVPPFQPWSESRTVNRFLQFVIIPGS